MLRSAVSGSSSSGSPQQNITEIIQLLESNNVSVIEETTALVRDSLSSTSEPWLLNGLVDYYIGSGNTLVRRLITAIRQPQHKILLAKLDEYLQKPATRYAALNLFGHIVRKDPSWLHHIVQSRVFTTILKCLQLDNDVAALTIAMYVVSTLLPKIPTQMGVCLTHLFQIFVRLVSWKTVRGITVKTLNKSGFDAALYTLFLCLYGMYPCGFVSYLQQYYCKTKGDTRSVDVPLQTTATTPGAEQVMMEKKRHDIFTKEILPMLESVRLNSNLILYTKDLEVSNDKWRKKECHDIISEISQIPIEAMVESGCVQSLCDPPHEVTLSRIPEGILLSDQSDHESQSCSEVISEPTMIWSPSMEIGLSTPPPSRSISPFREVSDDKSKAEGGETSSVGKSKSRPSTLTISQMPLRGANLSTPCTPTQTSLSFEYDKGEEHSFDIVVPTTAVSESGCVEVKQSPSRVTRNVDSSPTTKDASITDFSPALLPSTDHLRTHQEAGSSQTINPVDALFIGKERPTVYDILQSADGKLSRQLSSSELLENEMQLSIKNDGVKQNTDLDWLHFGQGILNEKDSQSLQAGYLQMHCALLYEQHRRKQHAMRARRLMRKIYESSAFEERNIALNENLIQKDNEIAQLQSSIKTLKSGFSDTEKQYCSSLETIKNESIQLRKELKAAKDNIAKMRLDKNHADEILNKTVASEKQAQAEVYKCKLRLESDAKNKETNQDLRAQIVQLQKEMLVVEELSEKMQALQKSEACSKITEAAKHEMMIEAYKNESTRLKDDLRKTSVTCDFMKGKSQEMEKAVMKKNRLLEDQKKYLENVKSLARSQIQAMESKYQAQKSITMRMEVQIMELYSRLTAVEGQSSIESIGASRGKPIQSTHPLGVQYRYGHLVGASPELSPPIRLSMFDESTVATSELEASTGTDQ